jgi:hypothetical protein
MMTIAGVTSEKELHEAAEGLGFDIAAMTLATSACAAPPGHTDANPHNWQRAVESEENSLLFTILCLVCLSCLVQRYGPTLCRVLIC